MHLGPPCCFILKIIFLNIKKIVSANSKMVSANSKMVSADSKTVLAVLAVVLVGPLTLYRPSATVLIHFALKLIFPEYKKT